ncbi:MAG: SAM-dependent methyltransferase, partial [Steroidobacter sp.]
GLGYYSAGAHKLGAGGDFTTAPEISPLFSHCVANQCAGVLQSLDGGSVLELGAGSGVMAAEMLLHMELTGSLPEHYCILEVSADLQQRQQALLQGRLPHLVDRVKWLRSLPQNFAGIIVANEVLDALPVKRFTVINAQVHELGVTVKDGRFSWQMREAEQPLREEVHRISAEAGHKFVEGYVSEVNLLLSPWIKSLSDSLSRGAMLFFDYGLPLKQFYSADRSRGTLNCFFRHLQHEDPFVNVGVQDITAWVNFTALAEAGSHAELQLGGFSTQAHFLIGAGIESLLRDEMNRDGMTDTQRWQLSKQVQQLMLPDGMGETFKAMSFNKNCDVELNGFAFRDLRHLL